MSISESNYSCKAEDHHHPVNLRYVDLPVHFARGMNYFHSWAAPKGPTLALQTANYRIEELVKASEVKFCNSEAEIKQYTGKILELMAQIEDWQSKAYTLVAALQATVVKEPELSANLVVLENEKKKLEHTAMSLEEKVSESENLTEALRNELKLRQDMQDSIEKDLPASSVRENELMEKPKSAEEKLDQQVKHLALKLLEFNESLGKVDSLGDEIKIHKEQGTVSGEKEVSLKAQLEGNLTKLAILEETIEELEGKLLEGEIKVLQSF